nr:serine protease [Gordonia araii]
MRTTVKLAAIAVAAAMGLLSGSGPAVADPVSVNEKVSKALVFLQMTVTGQVQIPFESGPKWSQDVEFSGVCSGYVVDPTGFIATAGHCVYTGDDQTKNMLRQKAVVALASAQRRDSAWATTIYRRALNEGWPVRAAGGDGEKPSVSVKVKQPGGPNQVIRDWTTVQVVSSQSFKDGDNAILKLNSPPGELTALPISTEIPKAGEAVTSVGFPGQVRRVSDDITLPQPSFKTGTVSSRQQNSAGAAQTEVSATIGKGMSGGPTVNADGLVIGTNSMKTVSQEESSEFGFVTDNIALRNYLQSNGAVLVSAEPAGSKLSMWVWLGPLIGVILLLAIVGLLLGFRRKPAPVAAYPVQGTGPLPGAPQAPFTGQVPGPIPAPPPPPGPAQHPGQGPNPYQPPTAPPPPPGPGPIG